MKVLIIVLSLCLLGCSQIDPYSPKGRATLGGAALGAGVGGLVLSSSVGGAVVGAPVGGLIGYNQAPEELEREVAYSEITEYISSIEK